MPSRLVVCLSSLLMIVSIASPSLALTANDDADENDSVYIAKTTENMEVPVDQLALMVKPLTLDELQIEVDAWMVHLKESATKISNLEIAIKQQKLAIKKDKEAASKLETADTAIAGANEALMKAKATGDREAVKEAERQLKSAAGEKKKRKRCLTKRRSLKNSKVTKLSRRPRMH